MWLISTKCLFSAMRFKLKGAEEGHYYGIHVRRGEDGWSTGFNQIDEEDGVSGMWEAELGLKTGAYTYALERQDYATQQVDFLTLGAFDMEEQQEVEIDLSKTESVPVEVSVANLPDFMEGRSFTCEVSTSRGERLWRRDEVPDPFAGRGICFQLEQLFLLFGRRWHRA